MIVVSQETFVWSVVFLLMLLLVFAIDNSLRASHLTREKVRRERDRCDRERMKLLDHQQNLGNRIFNACVRACHSNPSPNRVQVEKIPHNGNLGYSIIVGWREDTSFTMGGVGYRGYPVAQINVAILENHLTVNASWGPYPNEQNGTYLDMTAAEFEGRLEGVISRIASYSPYGRAVS